MKSLQSQDKEESNKNNLAKGVDIQEELSKEENNIRPSLENITKEIKEIDGLLNKNLENEFVDPEKEIIVDTEINRFKENNEDKNNEDKNNEDKNNEDKDADKLKISDLNDEVLVNVDNLNSDIEDLDLDIDELP